MPNLILRAVLSHPYRGLLHPRLQPCAMYCTAYDTECTPLNSLCPSRSQALILGLALGIGLLLIVALCAYRSWRRRRMAQGKAVSGLVHQQAGSPQFFPA